MLATTVDSLNKVFSGRKCEPIYNLRASLGDLLIESVLKDETKSRLVQKYVKILKNEVKRGDVVSSIVPGLDPCDPNLMLFYVATILHGNPIHFIDHRSGSDEIKRAIEITNAKTINVELDVSYNVEDKDLISLIGSENADPVALFTTAGISGLPKLVPLSAATIIHHLSNHMNSHADGLSFQPLSKYRIFFDGLAKFMRGASFKICTDFCMKTFHECSKGFHGDLYLTNYQLARIVSELDGSVETVQQIHCSGSYANPILIRRAKTVFPNAKFVYSYGLTEFGGPIAINPDTGAKYTVGKLNNNFEVAIKDANGEHLDVGSEGEIFIRSSPSISFQGYYKNDECTKIALTEDGWCRTGDIGYFDQDLDFHILDREKEVIVCDCNVISIAEMEHYLMKIPGVSAAKVFGIPDKDFGEKPAAKIIRNSGSEVTADTITEFILCQLGPLKALKGGVKFVAAF